MTLPPDNETVPEDLPLRHRASRAQEAERIRQEFVMRKKRPILSNTERSAKEMTSDE
jgi:hypothetical protein